MPATIEGGVAVYRAAVNIQQLDDQQRAYIEFRVGFQNAYDSVDILSHGKPVEGGLTPKEATSIAGVIGHIPLLAGVVRPNPVHVTNRQGKQLHPSCIDKMP